MLFFRKRTLKHAQISQREKAREADELYRLGVTCYREFDPSWKENLTKSADLGSDRAMRYLGKIYEQRLNFSLAAHWYEKACSQGNNDALIDLGKLYLKSWDGCGNSENPRKAEECFNLAINSGNENAYKLLKNLKDKFENSNVISKEQANAVELFALNVIKNGYSRYKIYEDDTNRIDTIISWLQDCTQINFTCPNKTAALLNFRLLREDLGASFFDYMLQLKYNPIYELLLSVTLLFEPQLDTPQIISRLNNVVTYLFDSPERSEEFPEFLEISNNLYETVRINEPRLNDEILYEKAMSKINEAIDPLYAVLEIVLYI